MQRVAIDLHDSLLAHSGVEASALVLRAPWKQNGYRTPLFLASAAREIRRLAMNGEIDAVLFSSMVTATLTVPLRKILQKRGVLTASIVNGLDATTPTWPYPQLVKRVFDSVDLVLPISNATAAACHLRGLSTAKTRVVHLGIKPDRFTGAIDRAEAREILLDEIQSLHPSTKPRLILANVGRLVPRKGIEWFVTNVMPMLQPDVHLVVAGEGPDRKKIEAAISGNNVSSRVTLLGKVTDEELEVVYRGSDLFVMPNVPVSNDMEGFGLVMVEANMCGLPVIASNIEGIADVVSDGENGTLIDSGDAEGFCHAIMKYHGNTDLLRAASTRAQLHAALRFGWSAVTDRYIEVIREHVSARRPSAASAPTAS
jgi:phosphatidylinositol alpha-1,6-mannosyltransferase